MPNTKSSKDTESLQLTQANAKASNTCAPGQIHGQATGGDDANYLPLIWEKVSDKILKHINDRFDKLDQTPQVVQSSQKELMEKVESIK